MIGNKMEKEKIIIRRATDSDIQDIEEILIDVVKWMKKNHISNMWTEESVKWSRLNKEYSIKDFYVGIINNELVACMALTDIDRKYWKDSFVGDALYMHKLAVKRKYAGFGISNELIQYAINIAVEKNVKSIRLDCNAEREKLRAIYEKMGFQFVKIFDKKAEYKMALYQKSVV